MNPEIMSQETLFVKDRAFYFLNQTILSPVNAQKLAPMPEIAETPLVKQQKEEALAKAVQQIKDLNFTTTEINSLLRNILNGFAREARGWNQYAIRASLRILPFIGLTKITSGQIAANYRETIVAILPSHTETTADGGFEALVEAGMILLPHMSTLSRKKTNTQVLPVLRQELKKRQPYINSELFEDLAGTIDDLDNSLKTGQIKLRPIDISPKDTTEIANKFRQLGEDLRYKHFSPEEFATLDSLVKEAIRDFGMNAIQITEMSRMAHCRITDSIRRLKKSGSIPDRYVTEDSLSLQVQELLGKGGLTQSQIAHALGPGITAHMVNDAKQKLRERKHSQGPNNTQENKSLEEPIIDFRRQDFFCSQIANQLDIPIGQVYGLINKLIREEKIERKIHVLPLNHPIIERGIKIDACVDKMQSNNPGITMKEIAKRLDLSIPTVTNSFKRLKVYRQIEELIAQEKTALRIAQARGTDQVKAKFDIARLQKLRDFQHNLT